MALNSRGSIPTVDCAGIQQKWFSIVQVSTVDSTANPSRYSEAPDTEIPEAPHTTTLKEAILILLCGTTWSM